MARTIAIVEDEEAIRDNYKEAFTRQGYRVDTYSNRADAMVQFRSFRQDVDTHTPTTYVESGGPFAVSRNPCHCFM